MKSRGLNQSRLAKRAGVTRGTISNIMDGARKPGPELCLGIAVAFHLPPEDVFRIAGLLPPKQEDDLKVHELEQLASILDEKNKDELLRIARLKVQIQEERGEYDARKE